MIVFSLVLPICFVCLLFFAFAKGRFTRVLCNSKSPDITSTSNSMSDDAPVSPMFCDGWLTVDGLSSHILTWGGWVEDPLPEGDSILVFMCGVPGITLFYKNFLESLYNHLKIPVWTICIPGHELPPSSTNLKLPADSKLYNSVASQVAHKKAFVANFVPQNRKIYLVGHSFGAKMVTELLKDEEIRCRTEKCVLLMPTLERFGDTPRAKYWLKCQTTGFIYVFVFLLWVVHCLPLWWKKLVSYLYFHLRGFHNINNSCVEGMVQFCNPNVFYNVRSLVYNELETIKQLDIEVLTDSRDKIKVYFAREDHWAPLTHCETLKTAVPKLSIEILEDKFVHAFSLGTAEAMADIVVKDLQPDTIEPTHKTITQTDSESLQDRVKKYLKSVGLMTSSEQASERFKSLTRQLSMKIMAYRLRDSCSFSSNAKLYEEEKIQSEPLEFQQEEIECDDNIVKKDSKELPVDQIYRTGNYTERGNRFVTFTDENRLNSNHEKKDVTDDIDLFFTSVTRDVQKLPRRLQNKVKRDVLNSILQVEEEQQCYFDDNTLPLYSWNSTLHRNQSSTVSSSVHVSSISHKASKTFTSSSKSSLQSNKLYNRNQKTI